MNRLPAALALLAVLVPPAAFAEELVTCTPEYYFNSSEQPPILIPIDAARLSGSHVIHIDLETGVFRALRGGDEAQVVGSGTMAIINRGSLRERIDFVATLPETADLLRISLIDDGLPYIRVDDEGSVASGHCVYE